VIPEGAEVAPQPCSAVSPVHIPAPGTLSQATLEPWDVHPASLQVHANAGKQHKGTHFLLRKPVEALDQVWKESCSLPYPHRGGPTHCASTSWAQPLITSLQLLEASPGHITRQA
jgi:hypothetical protein